jgi:hypothetical protein
LFISLRDLMRNPMYLQLFNHFQTSHNSQDKRQVSNLIQYMMRSQVLEVDRPSIQRDIILTLVEFLHLLISNLTKFLIFVIVLAIQAIWSVQKPNQQLINTQLT